MQWSDEALILNIHKRGENSAILSLFTPNHGRHMGLFSGLKNKKNKAFLQIGSGVQANWTARLESQLGRYILEPKKLYWVDYMSNSTELDVMLSALSLIHSLLPERQSYPYIYQSLIGLLEHIKSPYWAILYTKWEAQLLADIGFGLDLSKCALSGSIEDLAWVSPHTGKVANYAKGLPWKENLMILPPFFTSSHKEASIFDLINAFHLTGHFLQKSLDFHGGMLPNSRKRLIDNLYNEA